MTKRKVGDPKDSGDGTSWEAGEIPVAGPVAMGKAALDHLRLRAEEIPDLTDEAKAKSIKGLPGIRGLTEEEAEALRQKVRGAGRK
jgi:hypothetical protein